MKFNASESVAAYLLRTDPSDPDPTYQEAKDWIQAEHFPTKDCSAVLSPNIPSDLPKDMQEHLRVAQAQIPNSIVLVVRPITQH